MMKSAQTVIAFAFITLLGTTISQAQSKYALSKGNISFQATANQAFLKINGSTSSLQGTAEGFTNGNQAVVRNLVLAVDTKTFKTGMSIRDKHLYEKVFTASNGAIPKITISVPQATLKSSGKGRYSSAVNATVSMGGKSVQMPFHVELSGKESAPKVSVSGTVSLTKFKVPKLSYMGVTVNNDVKVASQLQFKTTR